MRSKILLAAIFIILSAQALFAAGPTITSFSPAKGPAGTLVTITGTNLGSPTAFSIAGVPAIVVSNTGTKLVGLVMPGAATGVVSITASGGTANSTAKFTVTPTTYPYVQEGNPLDGTNAVGQPYQGNSVAISADGNTALVAGYNDNSNQGAVWAYTRSNGAWTQQGAKLTGAGASGGFGAYFGTSVSLSADGNTAAIGGPDDNTGTGAIWIFTRTAGVWTQQGNKLVGTGAIANNGNPEGNAQQGQSLSISADGNTLLEGGWFDNGGIGAAWFFTRTAGTWTQLGNKIVGTNIVGNAYFGRSVALSADGNTAAIGGPADNAAWFYSRSGATWTQSAQLTGTGSFGYPVALNADGSTAIIGASSDSAPLGAAWIYTRSGTTWPQANGVKLVGTGGFNYSNGSTEGAAVAISADGNTAVIGGPTDGITGANSTTGAMWVFTRSGGVWTQQGNKISGTGGSIYSNGEQGSSVALSADGTTLIEGAPESGTNTGLAVVFTPILPSVTTEAATAVAATTANLNGYISANGITGNVSFEYGTAADLTGSTTTTTFSTGANPFAANVSNVSYASSLTGLTASTIYYFRIDATNVNGTAKGTILSFTTPAGPPPPPPVITFTSPGYVYYGSTTTPVISSTDKTQPFNYFSHNTAVATITADGKFLAVGLGTASITAYQYAPGTQNIEAVADGTITVLQAPLTITADNKTVPFGQPIPTLTATITGFVNGDTQASFSEPLQIQVSAVQNSPAGTYNIFVDSNPYDQNYNITLVSGTLTITPVFPVPSATTVVQTNVSATGATLNGTANGNGSAANVIIQYTTDDQDGLENLITATLTTGPPTLPAGSGTTNYSAILIGLQPSTTYYYIITASNSEFSTTGNILSFTTPAAALAETITFPPLAPVTYGYLRQDPGATSNNATIPITYTSSNAAVAIITNGKIQVVGVGTTTITASQAGNATYSAATPVTQTFTVTPAPLIITADNQSTVYGAGNPPLTVSYNSFVNGDTQTSLTTQPTVITTATITSVAGIYPITASGAVDPNYTITYTPGTLTVSAVPPTVVTQAATSVSATGATLNGTVSDGGAPTTAQFLFGTDSHLSGATTVAVTTGTSPVPAGTGTVAFTGVVSGLTPGTTYYYEITGTNSTGTLGGGILSFTTASAPISVITFTGPTSAVYGSADLSPNGTSNNTGATITYASSNTAVATITDGDKIHIVGAGTTQITASQAAAGGFTAANPVSLAFTVTPAPLTVTAFNTTKVYGSPNPGLAYHSSGFVNGDDSTRLNPQVSISTTATSSSGVGNYVITVSGAADPNYAITYVAGNLKINPAPLTITADNKTKVQGSVNPALTVTYTGFVNEDGNQSLSTQPTITTSANTTSETGTYTITASGAVDPNYTITYVAGTLTVTPQFAFNPIPAKTYGDPDFDPGATGTNVTYSSGNTGLATIVEGKVHIVGAGITTITASSGENSIQQPLVINPAPLTITATDQTKTYGAANPALTVTYTGFVYSDNAASLTTAPTVSTTAVATSNVGSYPITASGAVDANYTISYAAGTLTVAKASQTIDFAAIPNQLVNGKYDLSGVTATSGLPVSFRLSDPGIAAISGTILTSLQVGNETVTGSQAGNGNYLPAADVENSFSIQDDNGNDVIVNPVVSPNGDGIDDVLNIKGIENYPDNKLTLVNRNGVMIFQMTNYNNTTRVFDGHSSVTGVFQQQGTLLYILEYKVNGEIKRKTGFTVLRY